ncbi:hypothetical protein ACI3PL_28610, partial [Lacticaseibacillus paracasei]
VDEIPRSAIGNVGYSLGSYYADERSIKEVDVMRSRGEITVAKIFERVNYSSMNDWMTSQGLPNGLIMRPWRVRMIDDETNL